MIFQELLPVISLTGSTFEEASFSHPIKNTPVTHNAVKFYYLTFILPLDV